MTSNITINVTDHCTFQRYWQWYIGLLYINKLIYSYLSKILTVSNVDRAPHISLSVFLQSIEYSTYIDEKTNHKYCNVLSSLGWVFLVGVSGGSFDVWYLDFRRKFRRFTISNWGILWGISSCKKDGMVSREEKWYRRFSFCPFEITFTRKVRWSGPPVNL